VICGAPLASLPEALPPAAPVAPGPTPVPEVADPPAPGVVEREAAVRGGTGQPPASQDLQAAKSLSRNLGDELPVDGPRTLVGFLVSYENVEVGQYWPIHQGKNVLGRHEAAIGLDIEIAHPTTSSLHAVLLAGAKPGRVVVEDTNSTNGTFVNDNVLAPGQRWELRDGDRVRFGLFNTIIKVIQP
jgi:FHA domain-containing protein